jgi:hypothetical protein
LIVQGEGVRLYLFILISFIVEGEGVEVNVFFFPSFDMCKEEGKGISFFRNFFFDMLKGDGRGKGLIFLRVCLIHFILAKIN